MELPPHQDDDEECEWSEAPSESVVAVNPCGSFEVRLVPKSKETIDVGVDMPMKSDGDESVVAI